MRRPRASSRGFLRSLRQDGPRALQTLQERGQRNFERSGCFDMRKPLERDQQERLAQFERHCPHCPLDSRIHYGRWLRERTLAAWLIAAVLDMTQSDVTTVEAHEKRKEARSPAEPTRGVVATRRERAVDQRIDEGGGRTFLKGPLVVASQRHAEAAQGACFVGPFGRRANRGHLAFRSDIILNKDKLRKTRLQARM